MITTRLATVMCVSRVLSRCFHYGDPLIYFSRQPVSKVPVLSHEQTGRELLQLLIRMSSSCSAELAFKGKCAWISDCQVIPSFTSNLFYLFIYFISECTQGL